MNRKVEDPHVYESCTLIPFPFTTPHPIINPFPIIKLINGVDSGKEGPVTNVLKIRGKIFPIKVDLRFSYIIFFPRSKFKELFSPLPETIPR